MSNRNHSYDFDPIIDTYAIYPKDYIRAFNFMLASKLCSPILKLLASRGSTCLRVAVCTVPDLMKNIYDSDNSPIARRPFTDVLLKMCKHGMLHKRQTKLFESDGPRWCWELTDFGMLLANDGLARHLYDIATVLDKRPMGSPLFMSYSKVSSPAECA